MVVMAVEKRFLAEYLQIIIIVHKTVTILQAEKKKSGKNRYWPEDLFDLNITIDEKKGN